MKLSCYLYVFFLLTAVNGYAGDEGNFFSASDPYAATNYEQAFTYKNLKPFLDALVVDGAIDNMPKEFGDPETSNDPSQKTICFSRNNQPQPSINSGNTNTCCSCISLSSICCCNRDIESGMQTSQTEMSPLQVAALRNGGYRAIYEIEDVSDCRQLTKEEYEIEKIKMQNAISRALKSSKDNAVLRPVYEGLTIIGMDVLAMGAVYTLLKGDTRNFGLGFAIFSFVTTLTRTLRPMIKAFYSWHYPGNDPYQVWENEFANKMPYIPHRLWPQIINTFGAARIGRFDYQKATDYFDTAFNLPEIYRYCYRRQALLSEEEISEKTNIINESTNSFFEDYENGDVARLTLRAAIRDYLRKLACGEDGFVCLHLHGDGGIGKTHYMRELAKKIQEVFPQQKIPVEEISIRSDNPTELEGSKESPGQVIMALSHIGKQKTPYGILVFDEASWLNGGLKETAKKMFEPNLGRFNSPYLDGLEFSLKGFLVAFLSNTEISDEALKSRMRSIPFPMLKKEKLAEKAKNTLKKYLRGTRLVEDEERVKESEKIRKALEKSKTMRDIDIFFPIAIEEILSGPVGIRESFVN